MKNYKVKIFFFFFIVLIVVCIGITYAWLTTTLDGEKEYVLKAGTLNLILDETSNGINISEAYPMSDEEGLAQTNKYTFQVENTGTVPASYTIYLDDAAIDSNDTRIADGNIKYALSVNEVSQGVQNLPASNNRAIATGVLTAGANRNYELRLWLKEDSTANYNEVFSGSLRIEVVQDHQ